MKHSLLKLSFLTSVFFIVFSTWIQAQEAKNVILMIGDGMGFNVEQAGSYWRFGEAGQQIYHHFPKKCAAATFSIKKADYSPEKANGYDPQKVWNEINGFVEETDYTRVTDSAASGTALNWGLKTLNGRIGRDFDNQSIKLFSEYAQEKNRVIGAVSTGFYSDATPGAVAAHQENRGMHQEISTEHINNPNVKIMIGSGHPLYDGGKLLEKNADELNYNAVGGQEIWKKILSPEGFMNITFVDAKEDFEELALLTPDRISRLNITLPDRIMGRFRTGGDIAPIDGAQDEKGMELVRKMYPQECFDQYPTLSTLSLVALNVLSQNPDGFYLMIEGGAIDHANHGRNINQAVLECTSFAKAIEAVCDWVEKYSSWEETLLIITADHETGQLWGPDSYSDANGNGLYEPNKDDKFLAFNHIENRGQSVVPGTQYAAGGHSNALVPVWAKGAGSEYIDELIRGNDPKAAEFWNFSGDYLFNSDIPRVMLHAIGCEVEFPY